MTTHLSRTRILLYGLGFLLFFQLVSDFVESIYTFGLLQTNIPPEIISVVFFFSPLLLVLVRGRAPRRAGLDLAGVAAVLHALEVTIGKSGKLLASGLGVGCLLILLPLWLAQSGETEDAPEAELGVGLALALALSILFRSLGAWSDITLLYPALSWILAAVVLGLAIWLGRERERDLPPAGPEAGSFGSSLVLSLGFLSALLVLYFAFASPGVLARWSGLDERLVVGLLAAALGLYFTALSRGWLERLSRPAVMVWNAVFTLAGAAAILINQVRFPLPSSAYPVDQPALSLFEQIPLLAMILLCPIVLLDCFLWAGEVRARRFSLRTLGGGFTLGALIFLLVVVGQVFTTVYDYIPLIGPAFRDRFWAVFLLACLGMALPVLMRSANIRRVSASSLNPALLSAVWVILLAAFAWVLLRQPAPAAPQAPASLRVLTYNIQQGYAADGARSYADQLALIRSLAPDIVGLQESDVARFSGGNADVVRTIAEGLGMNVYAGPRTVTGTFGIALLSRYSIENPRTFFMYSLGEQTAAIQAQISANGKKYTILVTHLGNDGPLIQQQQVLGQLKNRQNIIAMGDFNFDTTTPQYALTLQTLQDGWVQAGSPPVPGMQMSRQIDHIFVSPGVRVLSARYIASPASDHPALILEVGP